MGNYYWPQIDLLVLSGRLKADYEVTLVDAIATRRDPGRLLLRLAAQRFHTVIFLTSLMSVQEDFSFVRALKERSPETRMVGNGGLLLVLGEEIMERSPFLDAVLLDFTSEHILGYLAGQRAVPDLITRNKGRVARGGHRKDSSFSYPVPLHEQLAPGRYLMPIAPARRFTVSITSTGCRFGCTFCVPCRNRYRLRCQDNVLEELTALERAGYSRVVFHDINFVSDPEYVARLCRRMIERRLRLKWAFQTRVDAVDEQLLALVRQAGCTAIEYGVESGDNDVLRDMNKGISVEQVRRTFRATHRHGIRSVGFFMVGMPGETRETIRKTIDLAIAIDCDYASFSVPVPHPGTKLGETLKWEARVQPECSLFSSTPAESRDGPVCLDPAELQRMRAVAYRRFYLRPGYFWKRVTRTESVYEAWLQFRVLLGILQGLLRLWRHSPSSGYKGVPDRGGAAGGEAGNGGAQPDEKTR